MFNELTLEEVMLGYAPTYPEDDSSWADTFGYILSMDSTRQAVESLAEELKRDGSFREPLPCGDR